MTADTDRDGLLRELGENPQGLAWCQRHARLVDRAIEAAFESCRAVEPGLAECCVVAAGSYGRRELAPFSDVDVAVVRPGAFRAEGDAALKRLFRELVGAIESMGLRIGYTILGESEAAGLDHETISSLMDSRPVVGDHERWQGLVEAVTFHLPVAAFVLAKLDERRAQESRTHDTPYFARPDVKSGCGGLRAFHAAEWIRVALGMRKRPPPPALDTLLCVRNLLHLLAGRRQDQLDDARRAAVAAKLGCGAAELGSRVAEAMAELDAGYRAVAEALPHSEIALAEGVRASHGEVRVAKGATLGSAAVGVANAVRLGVAVPRVEPMVSPGVSAGALMHALATGEATVRAWDRCGLLAALLPELVACRTLLAGDPSHSYTVFEHTLRVVRNLDGLPRDGFLANVAALIPDRAPLVLAALLHDVGKAVPGKPHSQTGESLAREVCKRWGLFAETTELVAWLVREHLTLAATVRTRDIALPETVHAFADLVGNQERLAMLTLLTWADVSAVYDGAWSPMQESLVAELFVRTHDILRGTQEGRPSVADLRARLAGRAARDEPADADLHGFLDAMPAQYVVATGADQARRDFEAAKRAARGEPTVDFEHHHDVHATTFAVVASDSPGLLSRILGVFYAHDLSLISLRAATTPGPTPVIVDRFTVSFGGRTVPARTAEQVDAALRSVLSGEVAVEDVLRARGHDSGRAEAVQWFSFVEGDPGILEVRATRGRGMPFRLSRLIAEAGWNILAARVGQWAGMGTASFYLSGEGGRPVTRQEVAAVLEPTMVTSPPR